MKTLISLLSLVAAGAVLAEPPRHPVYEPDGKDPQGRPAVKLEAGAKPWLTPVSMRQRFGRDALSGVPVPKMPSVAMQGWRGERVSAQVLIESPAGFEELRLEPCVLRTAEGREIPVRLDVVRYTVGAGVLFADILDGDAQPCLKGVVRPLVLTVDIPADVAPGEAKGTLALRVNGVPLSMPIGLTIDPETLPPPREWKCHLDIWQHPDAVAQWHDVPVWSDAHFALMRPYMERLADAGQKTITATLIDEAWDRQTYGAFGPMVRVTKRADGSWAYDFSVFDRWVSFMSEEIGLADATVSCYGLLPWSLTFAYHDEAQGRTVAPRLTPGSPDYEAFWGPYLEALVAHVREKGWEDRVRLAMDERPDALFRPTLEVVRRHAPSLKIVAACDAPSAITADFDDCSYGLNICERLVPLAKERRAQGKLTTFYVCCAQPRPNTFAHSALAEAEWLLPAAAHYGLDGFLRWAYQSWPENPFMSQDYRPANWPAADTSLVYPGNRSSLRWEALRNGVETFEKIRLLREKAARLGRPEALKPLDAALGAFTVARGMGPNCPYEADLRDLDEALLQAAEALR